MPSILLETFLKDPRYSPLGEHIWRARPHYGVLKKNYYLLERLSPLNEEAKVLILTPKLNPKEHALFEVIRL